MIIYLTLPHLHPLLSICLVEKLMSFSNAYLGMFYAPVYLFVLLFSIEERVILKELVEQALACKTRLTEIVNSALACVDKDLSVISGKLTTALKVCCRSFSCSISLRDLSFSFFVLPCFVIF